MTEGRLIRCTNCGTEWSPATAERDATTGDLRCPVCALPYDQTVGSMPPLESISDFEAKLDALLAVARASGLDNDALVHALRDELEFSAELAHTGRRFSVQLIDLGPQEGDILQRPARMRPDTLPGRVVGT